MEKTCSENGSNLPASMEILQKIYLSNPDVYAALELQIKTFDSLIKNVSPSKITVSAVSEPSNENLLVNSDIVIPKKQPLMLTSFESNMRCGIETLKIVNDEIDSLDAHLCELDKIVSSIVDMVQKVANTTDLPDQFIFGDIFKKSIDVHILNTHIRSIMELLLIYLYKKYHLAYDNKDSLEWFVVNLRNGLDKIYEPFCFNTFFALKSIVGNSIHHIRETTTTIIDICKTAMLFNRMALDMISTFTKEYNDENISKRNDRKEFREEKEKVRQILCSPSTSPNKHKTRICHGYVNGNCKNGSRCRFAHVIPNRDGKNSRNCKFDRNCDDPDCPFSHPSFSN